MAGGFGYDAATAGDAASNAAANNFLGHRFKAALNKARMNFANGKDPINSAEIIVNLESANHDSDSLLERYRANENNLNEKELGRLTSYLKFMSKRKE